MSDWASDTLGACEVCGSDAGKYRCPRCGVVYCSVACFKGHSAVCCDKFGKDFVKHVPHKRASFEAQMQMQRILSEDSSVPDCEVEPWQAWWEAKVIGEAPMPTMEAPPKVSPLLKFHLANIAYSYCYVMRLYNGDASIDNDGACEAMLAISSVLSTKETFESTRSALKSCIERTRRSDLFVEYQWQVEVVHDVELCLQTRNHVYRMLSEAIAICHVPKLTFFFAWSQTLTAEDLTELRRSVHDYYTSLTALLADVLCTS